MSSGMSRGPHSANQWGTCSLELEKLISGHQNADNMYYVVLLALILKHFIFEYHI